MNPFAAYGEDEISSEDKPKRSSYVSKKDVVIVAVVLAVVLPLIIYFYLNGRKDADNAYCKDNLHMIGQALLGYSQDHDGRLPPTHNMDFDGSPAIEPRSGLPVTWVSSADQYMDKDNDFICRTGHRDEAMTSISLREGGIKVSSNYGMYRGLSTVPRDQIPDPGSSFLIAETSNRGENQSYNPTPFTDSKPDGFLIGWDDGNLEFSKSTKHVTRLAFSKAASGYDGSGVLGRHGPRINSITVEGSYRAITPWDAKVEHAAPRLRGSWWADPNLYK